jgi:hypothetical protein
MRERPSGYALGARSRPDRANRIAGRAPRSLLHSQRPALPAGTQVGKYVIESHLGEGGNGAVYAALDSVLGAASLKLCTRTRVRPADRGALPPEAQAMALNHPTS